MIALLVPCNGYIPTEVVQSIALLTSFAGQQGYPIKMVGMTKNILVHSARNTLSREFLKTDLEWAFCMDSDMILEPRTIPVMMNWAKKLDAKFLSGIYYQRMGEHKPLILKRLDGKDYKDEYAADNILLPDNLIQPFKFDACGFGCVLLHRDVFANIKEPYFKNIFINGGYEVSEDFYFCKQLRDNNIDMWCIPELKCDHLGETHIVDKSYCKVKGKIKQIKL
jgi:hypothetical protein